VESPDRSRAHPYRERILLAITIIPVVVVFGLIESYPQPAEYFDFADSRTVFGVDNFWNVASNLLFLVFGAAGLQLLRKDRFIVLDRLRPAYVALFTGIALTAFGSGWFHLEPNNDTLFWDRLPMTIAFMSLFAIIIGEHIDETLGYRSLWPLLIVGAASVIYWTFTESRGAGDLRLYGLVQFLPMLLIPSILVMYRSVFDVTGFLWLAIALYVLAKLLEFLDLQIFATGELLSGHSLKHVAASLVPLVLIRGMKKRQRIG
jgi:hypothetical protein